MWDTFVHIALLVVWKNSSFVKNYMIVVCQIEYAAYYVITLFIFLQFLPDQKSFTLKLVITSEN